jgi:hypothetical protein
VADYQKRRREWLEEHTTSAGVLHAKQVVVMRTSGGELRVRAESNLRRTLQWAGGTREVRLQEKPDGSRAGTYLSYESEPGGEPVNGITRVIMREGDRDFATQDEAVDWLRSREVTLGTRQGGLAAGFALRAEEGVLVVEIWRISIKYSEPEFLPGAPDLRITLLE